MTLCIRTVFGVAGMSLGLAALFLALDMIHHGFFLLYSLWCFSFCMPALTVSILLVLCKFIFDSINLTRQCQ
jgi:hypothetical protein